MSGFLKEAVKNKYSGLPSCPERPGKRIGSPGGPGRKRDYSPLSWKQYFENSKYVCVNDKNMFRVYLSGYEGPVLLLLHGGGHSALSWSVFTKSINRICHCQVVAIDLRGHGDSKTENDLDLSADTLAKDVGEIVGKLYEEVDSPPPILMVGHSMGGAIAVHVSVKGIIPTLIGLAVIDVVEGTAMEALSSMQSFLKSRPSSFSSLEQGIEWSVRSGQVHNVESARISMVGQLVRFSDNDNNEKERVSPTSTPATNLCDTISEEPEEENTEATQRATAVTEQVNEKFTWRIDLSKTGHFWEGWFKDMSKLFLSCPVPKLLILAGIDRLDKELTIGQMQGKFQMQVLPRCGHCVHEDAPDKVAEVLTSYLVRLKLAAAKENFQRPMPAC
ncbi:protein phosphatase methylesterase 1-like isoform X1 [Acropora palmata]|uniref:protein phosphatase methylesterase 1-like isoform X1 n=2 Tax=Acropora palmata TaxID=6131 RepID=UPI003D9FB78E